MNEEWRFCKSCKKQTEHKEHYIRHGYIPYTCKKCGANTALLGYDEDGEERIEEIDDE